MNRLGRDRRTRPGVKAPRRLRLEALESRRLLAAFVVTTANDIVDAGDGVISLREAIQQANSLSGADRIFFDATVFSDPTVIDLALGELRVTESIEVFGTGKDRLTIDAGGDSRVLEFSSSFGDLTLRGMTLTGGRTTAADVNTNQSGGGIRFASAGTLTLDQVDLLQNQTLGFGAQGGGLFADPGNVAIIDSSIAGNRTDGEDARGGALYVGSGTLAIVDSLVSGNLTTGIGSRGGGIYSTGTAVSIVRSSLLNNRTEGGQADGGGLWTSANLAIDSSQVVDNQTLGTDSDGGGIFAVGLVNINNSDLSGNSTAGIGAVGGALAVDSGDVFIQRSSITGNQTASQFSYGGGIFVIRSDITLRDSTVSANRTLGSNSDGGGVAVFFGAVDVNGSTIANNRAAGRGGGIAMTDSANRTLRLENSIVAGNLDNGVAPDFLPPINPSSLIVLATLVGDNTGTRLNESPFPDAQGNLIGDPQGDGILDPMLGPLSLTGTTWIHPLLLSSPAMNAGDNRLTRGNLTDQRGGPFVRIFASEIDMGAFESQVLAASRFTVDSLGDELNFGDQTTTLREALAASNGNPGSDTITFDRALAGNELRVALSDRLWVTDSVSIRPPTDTRVTLDGNGRSRIIDVAESAGNVSLSGLVISGGRTSGAEGGGAGIRFASPGQMTLTDSQVLGNQTAGSFAAGGGIEAPNGRLVMTRSVVTANVTRGDHSPGGGIHAAQLIITDTTIEGNQTLGEQSSGGGVAVANPGGTALIMRRSTLSNNVTTGIQSHGGGLAILSGQSTVLSSTISGNAAAGSGGGIYWSGDGDDPSVHQLLAVTVAGNASDGPGGGLAIGVGANAQMNISSSLVATNQSATSNPDLDFSRAIGPLTLVSNLIGDGAGTSLHPSRGGDLDGNLIGSSHDGGVLDPLLGALATRGGMTASHSLLAGSPAIDASRPGLLLSLDTDQRGQPFVRVFGAAPDIGSFENQTLDSSFLTVTTVNDEFDRDPSTLSLREAIEFAAASDGIETIRFDETLFSIPQIIRLTLGPLAIEDSVRLAGPGDHLLTVDAQSRHRVFDVSGPALDVTIGGLKVTGGSAPDAGGGIRFVSDGTIQLHDVTVQANRTTGANAGGGGLFVNGGTASIVDCLFEANETRGAGAGGGAIFVNSSHVSIVDSSVLGNQTVGDAAKGGGLHSFQSALQLNGVVVSSNFTDGDGSDGAGIAIEEGSIKLVASHLEQNQTLGGSDGGGLHAVQADVEIRDSVISLNRTNHPAGDGGGAAVFSGSLDLINSTLSGNRASGINASGGGLLASSVITRIVHSTITSNTAGLAGGGIAQVGLGTLRIDNSVAAENVGPPDSPDLFVSLSNPANFSLRFSLIGERSGTSLLESQQPDASGNRIGSASGLGVIDPMLGPLGDFGGRVPSHLPLPASPLIDAGDIELAVDADGLPLTFDGRGEPFARSFGTINQEAVDQGAVEVQPPRAPVLVWDRPANLFVGTPLGSVQLNASTNTDGTFTYTPPAGTVLPLGDNQWLSVEFVPANLEVYTTATASVPISVVHRSDRGDAPASYKTLHADDGPQHLLSSLRLGSQVDAEPDGFPSVDADGDGADDDGVVFATTLVSDPTRLTLATVMVEASGRGKLDAWIDFDRDGEFDQPSEHLFGGQSLSLSTGENLVSFAVPPGIEAGATYARFRISTSGGLLPTGMASDGEVEDYRVIIVDATAVPTVEIILPLGSTTLRRDSDELVIARGNRDLFRASFDSIAGIVFTGNRFSNVLVIDSTGGFPIPSGGFSFDGGEQVNTLRLVGAGLSLNLSASCAVRLANVDVIDLSDPAASTIRIDSAAARAMDPSGGGVVITGGPQDHLEIVDGIHWRMAPPKEVAGLFFSLVQLPDTFIQTDFSSFWQNLAQASDINNDGEVTAGDALRVVNELARRSFSDSETAELVSPALVSVWPNIYFDQNGDGRATALDALRVINDLARVDLASGEWMRNSVPSSDEDEDRDEDDDFGNDGSLF